MKERYANTQNLMNYLYYYDNKILNKTNMRS